MKLFKISTITKSRFRFAAHAANRTLTATFIIASVTTLIMFAASFAHADTYSYKLYNLSDCIIAVTFNSSKVTTMPDGSKSDYVSYIYNTNSSKGTFKFTASKTSRTVKYECTVTQSVISENFNDIKLTIRGNDYPNYKLYFMATSDEGKVITSQKAFNCTQN